MSVPPLSSTVENIRRLAIALENSGDIEKAQKGVVAAGTRVRKVAAALKTMSQQLRADVLVIKKAD